MITEDRRDELLRRKIDLEVEKQQFLNSTMSDEAVMLASPENAAILMSYNQKIDVCEFEIAACERQLGSES